MLILIYAMPNYSFLGNFDRELCYNFFTSSIWRNIIICKTDNVFEVITNVSFFKTISDNLNSVLIQILYGNTNYFIWGNATIKVYNKQSFLFINTRFYRTISKNTEEFTFFIFTFYFIDITFHNIINYYCGIHFQY